MSITLTVCAPSQLITLCAPSPLLYYNTLSLQRCRYNNSNLLSVHLLDEVSYESCSVNGDTHCSSDTLLES